MVMLTMATMAMMMVVVNLGEEAEEEIEGDHAWGWEMIVSCFMRYLLEGRCLQVPSGY